MQLMATTDYAIRMILYLATVGRKASSAEIAEKMEVPRKYLINITRSLREAGLIRTQMGVNGGYSLAKEPAEISLLDITAAMEGTMKINRCLEEDAYCNRFATEHCPVRKCYTMIQREIEEKLGAISIARLLQEA